MPNAAIIGSGFIGNVHASVYKRIDDVELVAIADINKNVGEEIAEKYGARFYLDAEEMLKNEEIELDQWFETVRHNQYY